VEERIRSLPQNQAVCVLESSVAGAEIFLNGVSLGLTEQTTGLRYAALRISHLGPGVYSLSITARNYQTRNFLVELEQGKEKTYHIDLTKTTGFLVLSVLPAEADLFINGRPTQAGTLELDPGDYTLEAQLFGARRERKEVRILADTLSKVDFTLRRAALALEVFTVTPQRFNPDNQSTGTCDIFFRVTAPSQGMVSVFSESREVWRKEIPRLTDWDHWVHWDGTDLFGEKVTDGNYTAVVTLTDLATGSTFSEEQRFIVSRQLQLFAALIPSGGAGSGASNASQALPSHTRQIGLGISPAWYWPILEQYTSDFYLPITFSFSMAPTKKIEYTVAVSVSPLPDTYRPNSIPFGGGVQVKHLLILRPIQDLGFIKQGEFSFGYTVHVNFSSKASELPETPQGIGAGLLTGISSEYPDSNWFAGLNVDATMPFFLRDGSGETQTADLPTWLTLSAIFKYQTAQFARIFWLSDIIFLSGTYPGIPDYPNAVSMGMEYLLKVSRQNLVLSGGIVLTYLVAKFKIAPSAGFWYYF
jgi:hypothetical protein